jgi:thiol:disulfide interchange protein
LAEGSDSMKGWYLAGLMGKVSVLVFAWAAAGSAQVTDPFGLSLSVSEANGGRELAVAFRVPDAHYLYAEKLDIAVEGGGVRPADIPVPLAKADPLSGDMVDVYSHDFVLRYHLDGGALEDMTVTVGYMGCNQQLCFMPQSRQFRLDAAGRGVERIPGEGGPVPAEDRSGDVFAGLRMTGRAAGYLSRAEFLSFVERVESGRGLERGWLEEQVAGRGIWIGILAILLGGLALNLTPCVLPMIPVNIAIIGAGAQAGSRRRGFLLGTVYGGGIALVYGVLGLVVVLTGSQFGALNASPWFNLGIAILFSLLALAMFGVFHLDFTRFQTSLGGTVAPGGSYLAALLFGGVAALLAGACVAPVVISVLVLATEFYQRGNGVALLLPFVLGVGMALPWPFAGAGLSFLPKPGRWMERVKTGFGVVILAAAAYYGYLGVTLLRPALAGHGEAHESVDGFWQTSPAVAVAMARETGKPLFIDFWATWCKNCKAMEATTLRDGAVLQALSPYVRLKYQSENLSDPAIRTVLDALGIRGLPSYVVMEDAGEDP